MDVDAAVAVHQIAHEDEAFVNHGDEGIRAAPPGVAVGDLFEEVRLFVEGLAANLDVHAEVRAHVEGRVNVDALEAAGVLDLAAERAALEGGEDELVVAPDEFVGPALDLPAAGVEAEFLVVALFLPGFVDVFEGLEGEDGGADFAGLAVPDEFDLALVGEEEEAVFLRERLALLDELDEVALLGVGEVVVLGGVWAGHGGKWFL